MEADYSVELAADDPALEFPWSDPEGRLRYYDLKTHPELLDELDEIKHYPELGGFLRAINSPMSIFETAKCDVWVDDEIAEAEEIFGSTQKLSCYVDMLLDEQHASYRSDFEFHEKLARRFAKLLSIAPEIPASTELIIRRCYFNETPSSEPGLYFSLYLSGFGDSQEEARQRWSIALDLLKNALLQIVNTDIRQSRF
jgi:hypothetical protein